MQVVALDTTPGDDLRKIEAAVPTEIPAVPGRPRRLLVVSSAPMYYHDAIPWGNEALRVMGQIGGTVSPVREESSRQLPYRR